MAPFRGSEGGSDARSIVCTVTATTAPVSFDRLACARCVLPSFIFVIRAFVRTQSLFEPWRCSRAGQESRPILQGVPVLPQLGRSRYMECFLRQSQELAG